MNISSTNNLKAMLVVTIFTFSSPKLVSMNQPLSATPGTIKCIKQLDAYIPIYPLQHLIVGYLDSYDYDRTLTDSKKIVCKVVCSPNNDQIATVSEDAWNSEKQLTFYRIPDFHKLNTQTFSLPHPSAVGRMSPIPTISQLAYSSDGTFLVCSQKDVNPHSVVWSTKDFKNINNLHDGLHVISPHGSISAKMVRNPNAFLGRSGCLITPVGEFITSYGPYYAQLCFSKNGQYLFSAAGRTIEKRDALNGYNIVDQFTYDEQDYISQFVLTPDEKSIVISSDGKKLYMYDLQTKNKVSVIDLPYATELAARIVDYCISPNGEAIFCAVETIRLSKDQPQAIALVMYNLKTKQEKVLREMYSRQNSVCSSLCFSPTGIYLASVIGNTVEIRKNQALALQLDA